jgi:hypothetical protein
MDAYARVDRDYNIAQDRADQWAELADSIEDSIKWAGESLHPLRYVSDEHKLQKCKGYLEDAIDTINNILERMDENGNN